MVWVCVSVSESDVSEKQFKFTIHQDVTWASLTGHVFMKTLGESYPKEELSLYYFSNKDGSNPNPNLQETLAKEGTTRLTLRGPWGDLQVVVKWFEEDNMKLTEIEDDEKLFMRKGLFAVRAALHRAMSLSQQHQTEEELQPEPPEHTFSHRQILESVRTSRETELIEQFVSFGVKREAAVEYATGRDYYIQYAGAEKCLESFLEMRLRDEPFADHRGILLDVIDRRVLDDISDEAVERLWYIVPLVGRFYMHLLGIVHAPAPYDSLPKDRWGVGDATGRNIFVSSYRADYVDQHGFNNNNTIGGIFDTLRSTLPDDREFFYHGTTHSSAVSIRDRVRVNVCDTNTDFSVDPAFYVTPERTTARNWAIDRNGQGGIAIVIFAVPRDLLQRYGTEKIFATADNDWRAYVTRCATEYYQPDNHAIVRGPVSYNLRSVRRDGASPIARPDVTQMAIRSQALADALHPFISVLFFR